MGRRIVCKDDGDDSPNSVWQQARKYYLTASDLYTFGNLGEKWWPGSRQEVLDEKCAGIPRVFGKTPEKQEIAKRKMAHGAFNEENNLRKFTQFAKVSTRPSHYFVTNDRWPWLGCTLDAIIVPPKRVLKIDPRVFTDAEHVQYVRDRMTFLQGTGVCELKQAENKATYRNDWFGYVNRKGAHVPGYGPAYNQPQIQAQMHITGMKWGVLVGQIGAIHMQVHLFERDESFAGWLDVINEEFRVERANYGKET